MPEDVIQREAEEASEAEEIAGYVDVDVQNRLWVKAIIPMLRDRSAESDPSDRVQLALDKMFIAACERVARIMRSDLPSERA